MTVHAALGLCWVYACLFSGEIQVVGWLMFELLRLFLQL